jgi:ATP-dependent RNA helicase DeaD
MVWFRMSVGRRNNADPRWLLPIICRRGHVTKKEVGAIRIFDRDTKFQVAEHAAGRFAEAVGKGGKGEDIRIERSEAPSAGPRDAARPRFAERGPAPERAESEAPRPPRSKERFTPAPDRAADRAPSDRPAPRGDRPFGERPSGKAGKPERFAPKGGKPERPDKRKPAEGPKRQHKPHKRKG